MHPSKLGVPVTHIDYVYLGKMLLAAAGIGGDIDYQYNITGVWVSVEGAVVCNWGVYHHLAIVPKEP